MSETGYVEDLREKIGSDLLLLPGVAAVIRDPSDSVLLQRSKEGVWNLPAGAVDPGETIAQAMIREVFEETGLTVRPVRLLGVIGAGPCHRITYKNGDVIESVTTVLLCEHIAGRLKPQDDETVKLQFFPPAEMPDLSVPYPLEMFTDPDLSGFFEWDDSWLRRS